MNKFCEREKKSRLYGKEGPLFRSEVHTIDMIGRNDGINGISLAAKLGVTRGAVSQMLSKLVAKGMVEKEPIAQGDHEIALHLTPRGKRAFLAHDAYHRKMYNAIADSFSSIPEEQLVKIIAIQKVVEDFFDTSDD